eukprot:1017016-Pyramimonas_sp.AAC.1
MKRRGGEGDEEDEGGGRRWDERKRSGNEWRCGEQKINEEVEEAEADEREGGKEEQEEENEEEQEEEEEKKKEEEKDGATAREARTEGKEVFRFARGMHECSATAAQVAAAIDDGCPTSRRKRAELWGS